MNLIISVILSAKVYIDIVVCLSEVGKSSDDKSSMALSRSVGLT